MKSDVIVLIPATTYNLITSDDVLAELQITNPSQADIDLINKHIAGISAAIAKYCDRVFPSEQVEETFWQPPDSIGFGYYSWGYPNCNNYANSIYVKRWPIVSIESIYVDDVALGSDSNDLSLRVDKDYGVLYRLDNGYVSRWYWNKSIVVTYTGGYDPIPEDLQRIAIEWASMAWFSSGQDSAVRSERVDNIATVTYSDSSTATKTTTAEVPDKVKLYLEPYMRKLNFA